MTLDRIIELESSEDEDNVSTPADKADDSKAKSKKTNTTGSNNKAENTSVEDRRKSNNTYQDREVPEDRQTREEIQNTQPDDMGDGDHDGAVAYDEDLDDRCYMKPDPGTCEEFIMRYFYYPDGGNCSSFIWSGCGGVVPFDTMAECREICQ